MLFGRMRSYGYKITLIRRIQVKTTKLHVKNEWMKTVVVNLWKRNRMWYNSHIPCGISAQIVSIILLMFLSVRWYDFNDIAKHWFPSILALIVTLQNDCLAGYYFATLHSFIIKSIARDVRLPKLSEYKQIKIYKWTKKTKIIIMTKHHNELHHTKPPN